ncbi:MAG TPA: MauE/DoxX family redox-associated membrane protein [Nonomuraea sp.]|nr:MauE/DoxX family redox-associated membrane protein [Nonomuraea sp.]
MEYVVLLLRAFLIGVFAVSAVGKLRGRPAWRAFTRSVRRIGRVPGAVVGPAAVAVVGAEVAIVVLLAVPGGASAGFVLAAGLLAVFSAALAYAVRGGSTEPCRCFGREEEPIGARHLGRNAVLLAAAVSGATLAPAAAGTPVQLAGAVVCLTAALVAAGAVVLLDDLLYLLR